MRNPLALFVVSALMFIFSIGFVVVAARTKGAPNTSPGPQPVTLTPIATTKQLMDGIIGPMAGVVFESVSTTVTEKGVEERQPRTDTEWAAVGNAAAALAESGNLMMMEGRAVDRGDWIKMSQELIDSSRQVLKAVAAKDPEGILAAGEPLNVSCDNCHQRYNRQ
jgi:hypothetical protein